MEIQLSMRWMKKLRAVCFSESEPFCLRLHALTLPPFSPLRLLSPFSATSHQWFLLFGVNIPNVSLFVYCISAVTERFSRGCATHATMGNHNTDHIARLEREMFNLTLSSCSVCLGPSHKGFVSNCIMLKKVIVITNLSHLINFIQKKMVVCKRLDYSQSTTSTFWSLKS